MALRSPGKTVTIENVTLGTWFPRTSLHLQEIETAFRGQHLAHHTKELMELVHDLGVTHVEQDEGSFRTLRAHLSGKNPGKHPVVSLILTEDGILLLRIEGEDLNHARDYLKRLYEESLSPLLSLLFGRGMPLPKELATIRTVLPFFVTVRGGTPADARSLVRERTKELSSPVSLRGVTISRHPTLTLIHCAEGSSPEEEWCDRSIRYLTFFREFESQLHTYLALHRDIWESIDHIHNARHLRYRDLTHIRDTLSGQRKTIGFVRARILQMGDVLNARTRHVHESALFAPLRSLQLDRFDSLEAAQRYLSHLWQVTDRYAESTERMLQHIGDENLRREVVILNTIVFGTLLTSFLGMNVPLPWEDRWPFQWPWTFLITALLLILAVGGYLVLHASILNRRFIIRDRMPRQTSSPF